MKKCLAGILSAIMLIMAYAPVGMAYTFNDSHLVSGTTEETMPTLIVEYLSRKANIDPETETGFYYTKSDGMALVTGLPSDNNANENTFYVGLRLKNMSKFAVANKGTYAIAGGIAYNSDYIRPFETRVVRNKDTEVSTADQYNAAINTRYSDADGYTEMGSDNFAYDGDNFSASYAIDAEQAKVNSSAQYNTAIGDNDKVKILQFTLTYAFDDRKPVELSDDEYIAVFKFKQLQKPDRQVIGISDGDELSLQFGIAAADGGYSYRATSTLEEYLKLDNTAVKYAKQAEQTGVQIKTPATTNSSGKIEFIEEKAITGPIAAIQKVFDEGDPEDVAAGDVTYYYGTTDKGAASFAASDLATGFTAVTLNNGIPKLTGTNYLYASDGKFAIKLGELQITPATVDTITEVTTVMGNAQNPVYSGDAVSFANGKFTVKGKLTNGKDYTITTNEALASNGLAFYKNNSGTLSTTLGNYSTPASGQITTTDTFYVAKTTDATVAKAKSFTVPVKFNTTAAVVTAAQKNALTVKYNAGETFDTSKLKANFATLKAPSGVETPYTSFPSNATVVIAADATTAVGSSAKAITAALDASDIGTGANGKKVYIVIDNNGAKNAVEVCQLAPKAGTTYAVSTQPTKTTYTYPETLDLTGIVFKATNPDDAAVNNKTYTLAEAQAAGIFDTVKIGNDTIVPGTTKLTKANSGKISFYKGTGATPVCESNAITVSPKTLGLVRDGNDAITKVYDGKTAATVAVKVNADDVVSGDTVTGSVTGLTFNYNNKNVGTDKAITATGTPALTGLDANKYSLAAASTLTGITGAITAKTLNITAITGVPSVKEGASGDAATVTGTLTLTKTNSDMIDGDALTLKYKATYTDTSKEGAADVTIDVTSAGLGLEGTDAGNYTLNTTMPATKGTVSNKVITGIEITVQPTKTSYTYPDLTLDTTGIKVIAHYADGVPDEDVTASVTFDKTTLSYGENTVTATFNGKTATFKVTANKKKINVDTDLTFTATKAAGADTVTVTTDVKDGVIESGDEVTITADGAFDDNNPGADKPVSITNIALTGAAAGNYELDKTTGSGTGEITAGSQTAPEKVEATVDNKTNNITVTAPVGANVEYSIDGGTTWQNEPLFTGLTAGTEYTVQARFKATATEAASPAAETKVTTYKYHVTRAKKGSSKINDEIYTSEDTVASAADMNSKVFAKKPSSFKAYFTDSACKEEVEYPFTMKAETALFYTTSGGGGGGGGVSTYIVKFSAGKYGKIENNENQNIESGKTVTKLPTVIPNDGYKFVGWSVDGGKTVIDPTTEKITKATTLTAVYEEVEATPTPTATPLIKNNLKPYASGYDDGMFLPNDYITRAELASMIARLINGDDISESYRASFPDVDNTWYNKYIGYLEDKDVLSGYEDGTFRPNQTVTRGEMCAIIVRAQRYGLIPMDGMFTDVTDADWAKDYITTLASMNIVSGYEDGTFGTYSPITRAETVAIINRVLKPSTPVITFTPIDIAGHWAEADILLAVNERELIGSEPTVTPEATPEVTPEPEATVEPETTPDPEATPEATAEPTETPAA